MSDIEPNKLGRCDVCGETNEIGQDSSLRVLEIPYHAINDIRKIDKDLADEIERRDGRIKRHGDCTHPIDELLPSPGDPVPAEEADLSVTTACSVCRMPNRSDRDECGRCGASLSDGSDNKRHRTLSYC